RRAVRAGHAFAECSRLHRAGPHRLWRRESRGIWLWACVLPLLIAAALPLFGAWALLGLAVYPLQAFKVWRQCRRRWPWRQAALYSVFCVLAKFPQAVGQLQYYRNRWRRRPSRLIEYKGPGVEGVA